MTAPSSVPAEPSGFDELARAAVEDNRHAVADNRPAVEDKHPAVAECTVDAAALEAAALDSVALAAHEHQPSEIALHRQIETAAGRMEPNYVAVDTEFAAAEEVGSAEVAEIGRGANHPDAESDSDYFPDETCSKLSCLVCFPVFIGIAKVRPMNRPHLRT